MKLKRFTKSKKIKIVFIGSIIGITLIIGGISLYRTFALYEEKKTFDVLNGTVPDFVYKEDILHGADPVLKSKTGEKLIPVNISDTGEVTKADIKDEWYSYAKKKWANAVILVDETKTYKNDEEIPEENIESYFVWIPKYKYKIFNMGEYTSLQKEDLPNNAKTIEIEFGLTDTQDDESKKECKTPGVSGESGTCDIGDWMTHPAFTAFPESKGFWVGKFETGYNQDTKNANKIEVTTSWTEPGARQNNMDSTKIIIKPNVYNWRDITVGNAYQLSYNYQRNLDSHMMKNTEWGAVAYLSHSKYGTCDENFCKEIRNNNSRNAVTGYAAMTAPTLGGNGIGNVEGNRYESVTLNRNGTYGYHYGDARSMVASTTGNYAGIYDMRGGSWEYVAAITLDENGEILYGQSGLEINLEDEAAKKYYDLYNYRNSINYKTRILGDATGEMGPFSVTGINYPSSSWYSDRARLISLEKPFIHRGGGYSYGLDSGIFSFDWKDGDKYSGHTFRICLAISN